MSAKKSKEKQTTIPVVENSHRSSSVDEYVGRQLQKSVSLILKPRSNQDFLKLLTKSSKVFQHNPQDIKKIS